MLAAAKWPGAADRRWCTTCRQSKLSLSYRRIPAAIGRSELAASSTPHGVLVDTTPKAEALIELLHSQGQRQLYLDFEGINLCRTGRLCIGQLTYPGSPSVWLLDFVVLPNVLEVTHQGRSLRQLLESEDWTKFFWDPRNDVDALYAQCGKVLPRNVICLQLCDVAIDRMKGQRKPYVHGLGRVLDLYMPRDTVSLATRDIKEAGKRLFAPECGEEESMATAIDDVIMRL